MTTPKNPQNKEALERDNAIFQLCVCREDAMQKLEAEAVWRVSSRFVFDLRLGENVKMCRVRTSVE